jgi:hypothetical protein
MELEATEGAEEDCTVDDSSGADTTHEGLHARRVLARSVTPGAEASTSTVLVVPTAAEVETTEEEGTTEGATEGMELEATEGAEEDCTVDDSAPALLVFLPSPLPACLAVCPLPLALTSLAMAPFEEEPAGTEELTAGVETTEEEGTTEGATEGMELDPRCAHCCRASSYGFFFFCRVCS